MVETPPPPSLHQYLHVPSLCLYTQHLHPTCEIMTHGLLYEHQQACSCHVIGQGIQVHQDGQNFLL